ncbi:hypothetical protein OAI_00110 [Vibrio cyclitrophicus FF160]|uniref:hypothetical protein n=1 Tax=Vibrio cyclitrophicus TaxID=47951 RepID=UPI0002FCA78D|nr:hypothetical protein [Vibrio cyclitrophicus]OEE85879.1 hypothetical protein OAI_00110 [Vibrio cyclitrophicus FF160]PMJ19152.1 hypothetical protein BCU28_15790 [Vibrio cyclitrophicus]
MSKYKLGETSKAVKDKKNSITKSIEKKAELIDSINSVEDIFTSLNIKGDFIAEASVHKWSDNDLSIISYSWNTAHAEHNAKSLKVLKKAIENANNRLVDNDIHESKSSQNKLTIKTQNKLRKENEDLKKSLAEVYRAYMHLVESYREDQVIDDAIRKLILDQARILGKQRIGEVK